jgi:hypothetical protein
MSQRLSGPPFFEVRKARTLAMFRIMQRSLR